MTQAHWLSAHMYFEGHPFEVSCDQVLRSVVWPLLGRLRRDRLVESAFFVRYADPRPHIRLRLLAAGTTTPAVTQAVEAAWADGGRRWGSVPRAEIRWIAYERETERYGGPHAMPAVERLFDVTSVLVARILTPAVIRDRSARLGRAVCATLVFLHRFLENGERVREFASRHAPLYLRGRKLGPSGPSGTAVEVAARARARAHRSHINNLLDGLVDGAQVPSPFATFADEVAATRDNLKELVVYGRLRLRGKPVIHWKAATQPLAESLVHMTYNRLGLTRFEEVLLALMLRECLCE